MSIASDREFDLTLFGATSFVGKLTAEYLATTAPDARIAIAGRSEARLIELRDSLGSNARDWGVIIADTNDPDSLDRLARRTTVVSSTVGPYITYGLSLVGACARNGTDYTDLTGEPIFVRKCIDKFHAQALDTGARIVHSCGMVSIPSDVNTYALHKRAVQDSEGNLGKTSMVIRDLVGGMSGGSFASGMATMRAASRDASARKLLSDPYTLSPNRANEPEFGPQPDYGVHRGEDLAPELTGLWAGGFQLSPFNARMVRRSNALLNWRYGRNFRYFETMTVGNSLMGPASALVNRAVVGGVQLGNLFSRFIPESLDDKIGPKPGTGPSQAVRDNGSYKVETYTETSTGARYRAVMAQQGDYGYKATSVLFAESAITLATARDAISDLRGVLTPATAMGDALIKQLPKAGVVTMIERLS